MIHSVYPECNICLTSNNTFPSSLHFLMFFFLNIFWHFQDFCKGTYETVKNYAGLSTTRFLTTTTRILKHWGFSPAPNSFGFSLYYFYRENNLKCHTLCLTSRLKSEKDTKRNNQCNLISSCWFLFFILNRRSQMKTSLCASELWHL